MSTVTKLAKPAIGYGSLVSPVYEMGLTLLAEDLSLGVDYTRNLSRLLFKSFFGCGVVCGLKVSAKNNDCGDLKIGVDPGIALDCNGDPIQVPIPQSICIPCGRQKPEILYVALRKFEKSCAPRSASSSCDDDPVSVCTRDRFGFEIQVLTSLPDCGCMCKPEGASEENPSPVPPPSPPPPPTAKSPTEEVVEVSEFDEVDTVTEKKEMKAASMIKGEMADSDYCHFADPNDPCYSDHYLGVCTTCGDCDCGCENWVLLAGIKLEDAKNGNPQVYHELRRFIRPVFARDPLVTKRRQSNGAAKEFDATMLGEIREQLRNR